MEEVRGARKEVDLRCHLEGSPPKLDFGQGWGNAEMSSCHDDLYGRAVLLMLRMKKKISLLLNRKIGSRRSSILPEFVDCSVRIYNASSL